ncbi:MAG: hypothetical protein IT165_11970 [Bryobacterales bacterium]|nr:hypothetical protein [Bryobacterales bacterium]
MPQQCRIAWKPIFLAFAMVAAACGGQDNTGTEGFSWKMGPVDVSSGQTAKLIFANPFCSNPSLKLDVTLAITDLTGQIVQTRGATPAPVKKRAIVNCNESIQIEVAGDEISPNGTVVGILQLIPDLTGTPWVPVNVPLASLQVGRGAGSEFRSSLVIIPIEPVRRLILP